MLRLSKHGVGFFNGLLGLGLGGFLRKYVAAIPKAALSSERPDASAPIHPDEHRGAADRLRELERFP